MARVIVVGAGWAGLATAVELSHHHIPVTVIEAAKETGGRARRILYHDQPLDNGQHLIIGAYRETLNLLATIGVSEDSVFRRHPLQLIMKQMQKPDIGITLPRLPAPFNLLIALARASNLSLVDRWKAIRLCFSLARYPERLEVDITVRHLLDKHGQSQILIKIIWEPLCLAIMNTPLEQASAEIFLHALRGTFTGSASHADLLIPRADLGTAFPDPASHYIRQQGGTILTGQRVSELLLDQDKVSAVRLGDDRILEADHVVLATAIKDTQRLVHLHSALQETADRLERFRHAPICTIYLQYPPQIALDVPMTGLVGTTAQWLFDRGWNGQAGLMAVVISAEGPHMQLDNDTLCRQVSEEIAGFFPTWPPALHSMVIREKRATFISEVALNRQRPSNHTAVSGCWLAGDYTATAYPATLEGAIHSGRECARLITAAIRG